MTPLACARQWLARGLSVIPIPRPRLGVAPGMPGDGKVPALAWKPFQTRVPTDAELTTWLGSGAPMNLAVVTGRVSNVIVIDGDSPEAVRWLTRNLPYTPWQTQTARGFHLWYRCPPGVAVHNRARIETRDGRLAIDIRGEGGYVIVPPSVHTSGAVYRDAGDWTVSREALPYFWPGWLQRPARLAAPSSIPARPSGDLVTRARKYLAAIPPPEIGRGSDAATFHAACRLTRGFELSGGDAEALLWEWAGSRPGWTRDWIAAKVAHAIQYGTEPIGALR